MGASAGTILRSKTAVQITASVVNSLCHVISDAGIDTSKLDEELLQEDRSLNGLLINRREQLESVFGIDLIYTIDLLFTLKGGQYLRHEIALDKLASGACYLHSSIYAHVLPDVLAAAAVLEPPCRPAGRTCFSLANVSVF